MCIRDRLYYSALIGYIWYEAPEDESNFLTLLDLINASEAREDDETYQSPVDILFQQLEEKMCIRDRSNTAELIGGQHNGYIYEIKIKPRVMLRLSVLHNSLIERCV